MIDLQQLERIVIHFHRCFACSRSVVVVNEIGQFSCDKKLNDVRDETEQKKLLRSTFMNMGWEVNRLLQLMENSDDFYFEADDINIVS